MAVMSTIRSLRKPHSSIGLDVGRSAVRAAQLQRAGNGWHVVMLGHWPLAPDDPPACEPPTCDRVASWLRRVRFCGHKTVLGLSPPDVELHAMELPRIENVDPQEFRLAAHHEVERLMSFASGEAQTDLWRVPPSTTARTTAIGVAAPKERVDRLVALCERSGLDCVRVDATACALARFGWVLRGADTAPHDVWGVLDLGDRRSRLIVCVDDRPVLARSFEYGGRAWTQRLADALGVSPKTAEQHKRDRGITPVSREASGPRSEGVLSEMIYNVLRGDLEAVLDELERSYRYVLRSYAPRQPGPLLLVGGGAGMRNLDDWLAGRLGIDVVTPTLRGQPHFDGIDLSRVAGTLREPANGFACAIGLALDTGACDAER